MYNVGQANTKLTNKHYYNASKDFNLPLYIESNALHFMMIKFKWFQ